MVDHLTPARTKTFKRLPILCHWPVSPYAVEALSHGRSPFINARRSLLNVGTGGFPLFAPIPGLTSVASAASLRVEFKLVVSEACGVLAPVDAD